MPDKPLLAVTRVRHPLKMRLLQVTRVATVTPHLVCVTLQGEDLHDFESSSFDDHVKVFFPPEGQSRPAMPTLAADGLVFPNNEPRPVARDLTPRRFDRVTRQLDLEFALHEAGPAAAWAAAARPGQHLGVGGPRGSFVIPTAFDWHVLIGDESALPAIARRLEELPAGARVAALLEVEAPDARVKFETCVDLYETWCYRRAGSAQGTPQLFDALRDLYLPPGEGYVWAAGEAATMREVRRILCEERGIQKQRIRAAAYWKRGTAAVHETIDD